MIKVLKKWWIVTLIIVGLGGVAQATIQTNAEKDNIIDARQTAYFQVHGQYFQILENRGQPSDQAQGWAELLPTVLGGNDIVIDVYDGPQGKGYIVSRVPPPFIHSTTT